MRGRNEEQKWGVKVKGKDEGENGGKNVGCKFCNEIVDLSCYSKGDQWKLIWKDISIVLIKAEFRVIKLIYIKAIKTIFDVYFVKKSFIS